MFCADKNKDAFTVEAVCFHMPVASFYSLMFPGILLSIVALGLSQEVDGFVRRSAAGRGHDVLRFPQVEALRADGYA